MQTAQQLIAEVAEVRRKLLATVANLTPAQATFKPAQRSKTLNTSCWPNSAEFRRSGKRRTTFEMAPPSSRAGTQTRDYPSTR